MMESRQPPDSAPFREQTWKSKWLLIGGAFLALWYSVRFLDPEWMSQWPSIVLLLVAGLAPQVFLLLFPLVTRDNDPVRRIHMPGVKRCLIESAIALPIVMATMFLLGGLNYLVETLFPGKTLTPDAVTGMASSSSRLILPFLLFSFTFAPVAEEVFFRGFMYNAFRQRMPRTAAALVQSLIFGFCHFFGTTHGVIAVALGLVMTGVYEWRKTLISPILVHAGINFISTIGVLAMMADHADRPMLGVIGGPDETKCIIREVLPDSAAFESGLMVDDHVVAFDGQPIANFRELAAAIATRQPADTVTLSLVRDGKPLDIEVTLKRRSHPTRPP